MQITIKNRISDIALVQAAFEKFAEIHGIPSPDTMKLNLIIDELISNIVSYAYHDANEHKIEVELQLAGNRLSMMIADDGIPFDLLAQEPPDTATPLKDREIGGLGIHLVINFADDISYQRRTDKNFLTVVKHLDSLDRNREHLSKENLNGNQDTSV